MIAKVRGTGDVIQITRTLFCCSFTFIRFCNFLSRRCALHREFLGSVYYAEKGFKAFHLLRFYTCIKKKRRKDSEVTKFVITENNSELRVKILSTMSTHFNCSVE